MKEKILLLGGSAQQIPAILYARNKGYTTVLCDYLPDNPGRKHADFYYNISTTDREAILTIARQEAVDGVVAYASDPAAPTAAYVAEQMQLPHNPLAAVETLAYKDLFRGFLHEQGFPVPRAKAYTDRMAALTELNEYKLPVMVKPVDSSGSKGVGRVDDGQKFLSCFDKAMDQSRKGRVIVEEYIMQDHPYMIAGDCFVIDGQVRFWGLLNSHRNNKANPFVPIGTSYPLCLEVQRRQAAQAAVQQLFDLLGIRFGAFNIEILIDRDERLYLIEIGPRNGGNMISELLQLATGADLIAATVETALGHAYEFQTEDAGCKYLSTYVLHASRPGVFQGVLYDQRIKGHIIKEVLFKQNGDPVDLFDGANKAIGIVFLQFSDQEALLQVMNQPEKWIQISFEPADR